MHFAHPLPWWLAVLLTAAIGAATFVEYRRPLSPLTRAQRGIAGRSARARPHRARAVPVPPDRAAASRRRSRDAVVPVLVDASRSMRLADADGQSRHRARDRAAQDRSAAGAAVALRRPRSTPSATASRRRQLDQLAADARRTDLAGRARRRARAVSRPARRRHRRAVGRRRHGGRWGQVGRVGQAPGGGPPVFAIGIGSPDGPRDREVLGIVAGDPRLDQASVDLHVTAVSTGLRPDAVHAARARATASSSTRGASCRPPTARRSTSCSRSRPIR